MKKFSAFEKSLLLVFIIIFITALFPRFVDIEKFLPAYFIDENEIVEYAVGFLGGDWDPHWYKYGPLYAYFLSFIYKIQLFFFDGDFEQFVQRIFFEAKSFYFTGRAFQSVLNLFLIFGAYLIARRYFSQKTTLIALVLSAFPFFDILTDFSMRIDTLLAVFSVFAVYFIVKISEEGKTIDYIIAGALVGLGLASKPLPGILIFPTIYLGHFFFTQKQRIEKNKSSNVISTIATSLVSPKIYLLLIFVLAFNFIGNPYSVLNFDAYWEEQVTAVKTEGDREFIKGYDITRFFHFYGYAFVIFCCISFFALSFKSFKNKQYLILLSYPLVFWLAFAKGASREYFYVPMLPFLLTFIAYFIDDLSEKASQNKMIKSAFAYVLIILIVAQPTYGLINETIAKNQTDDYTDLHGGLKAEKWVKENIPSGSKILFYGYYVALPRLVDKNPKQQMAIGEYFMYNRIENKFLEEQFEKAHKNYINDKKPAFDLITQLYFTYQNKQSGWNLRYGIPKAEFEIFMQILPQVKPDYVIATSYPRKSKSYNLMDSPYFQSKLVRKFTAEECPFGKEIYIFKIK